MPTAFDRSNRYVAHTGPVTRSVKAVAATAAALMLLSLFALFYGVALCVFLEVCIFTSNAFLLLFLMLNRFTLLFEKNDLRITNAVIRRENVFRDLRRSQITLTVTNKKKDRGRLTINGTAYGGDNILCFSELVEYIETHLPA